MGQKKVKRKKPPRVVIDTSVFISALLFDGVPGQLVDLWQQGKIVFLVSGEVLKEYLAVLSYPKFKLTKEEIKSLVESEGIPFFEPVNVTTKVEIINIDPADNKFLELAEDGKADFILSGDKHLLDLKSYKDFRIIPVEEFLRKFSENSGTQSK